MSSPSENRKKTLPKVSAPARRALEGAGYSTLEQLSAVSTKELLALHGMGPKALGQLRQALAEQGLYFADENPSPAPEDRP